MLLSSVVPEAGSLAGSRGMVGSSKLGFDCAVIGAGGTPGPLRVLPARLLPLPLVLSEIGCAKRFSWDDVIGKLNRNNTEVTIESSIQKTEQKKLLANWDSTSTSKRQRRQEEKPKENAVPRRVSGGRKKAPEKGLS